jgi:hypothetical protein
VLLLLLLFLLFLLCGRVLISTGETIVLSYFVRISILLVICQNMRQLNTQTIQLKESLRLFGSAPDETDIGKKQ